MNVHISKKKKKKMLDECLLIKNGKRKKKKYECPLGDNTKSVSQKKKKKDNTKSHKSIQF